jgi:Metallo-beta-lactamase superfamily
VTVEIIRDKTYRLGNAKITRVTETQLTALTPATLYPDWDEAVLDDDARSLLLGPRHERRDHVILSVSTWVIEVDGQIILVDTGIGNDKVRPFGQMFHQLQTPFLARLEAVGVRPENVEHVLLTHLHADHVGWNTRLVDGR